MLPALPQPGRYFPLDGGKFEVGPRLKALGADFGQGPRDGYFLQYDSDFSRFRENKLACRKERLNKYLATKRLDPQVEKAANRFLLDRLVTEHAQYFSFSGSELQCALTGETLCFDDELKLRETRGGALQPAYASTFDALCSQIQEDIAVSQKDDSGNWVSALHLCAPSHWAAEDKIGKDFRVVHEPVPGIEKMNRTADQLVTASIQKGPYTRFVFMFSKDNRLNHHTVPPPGKDLDEWRGWNLDFSEPCPFFLRVERQVVWGLPAVGAFLFSIHIFFTPGDEIRRDPLKRASLIGTLRTMTSASLQYKGLKVPPEDLIRWLES